MGDITKNISQHELKCKCGKCDFTIFPYELVIQHWQDACDHFARLHKVDRVTLNIISAARCTEYNRKPVLEGGPGSNDNSQHARANAIDGKIFVNGEQILPSEVAAYFDRRFPESGGIGVYDTFTHYDPRILKARW